MLRRKAVVRLGWLLAPGGRPNHQVLQSAAAAPSETTTLRCTAAHTAADKRQQLDEFKADPYFQCKLSQVIGGKRVRLNVTGRTVKEFELSRSKETVSELDAHLPKDVVAAANASRWKYIGRKLQVGLQQTFMPAGYPLTVGPNYLQFAGWQAITNFATTANSVLASTFLLYSVGLGAGAIPTAGALNWVLKDGLGQIGTLFFGKTIAHNFDIHSKTWYFLSIVLLWMATGMEILTIVVPQWFLIMGSIANMIKGVSWMAGGSTRSVFNLSFARDNNIADITAKGTSQYIFASLFGTAAGVTMCAYIGQHATTAIACYGVLGWASLYSSYRTVKSIPLPTLNSIRLQLLAEQYLACMMRKEHSSSYARVPLYVNYQKEYLCEEEAGSGQVLQTPVQLAEVDPPLPWAMGDQRILNPRICTGTSIEKVINGDAGLLVVLMTAFKYTRYILVPQPTTIHMLLHQEANQRDIIQAYLQACILRKRLKDGMLLEPGNLAELRIVLHDTLLTAEKLTTPFTRALTQHGWLVDKIVVEAERRRCAW